MYRGGVNPWVKGSVHILKIEIQRGEGERREGVQSWKQNTQNLWPIPVCTCLQYIIAIMDKGFKMRHQRVIQREIDWRFQLLRGKLCALHQSALWRRRRAAHPVRRMRTLFDHSHFFVERCPSQRWEKAGCRNMIFALSAAYQDRQMRALYPLVSRRGANASWCIFLVPSPSLLRMRIKERQTKVFYFGQWSRCRCG